MKEAFPDGLPEDLKVFKNGIPDDFKEFLKEELAKISK